MAKDTYEALIYQINTLIKQWDIFPKYETSISDGKNDFTISQTYTKKNYDTSWIDAIEECLVPLDTIVRNPRKFIVIEEDIVDISLARSISVESVKHLSQHTNLISSVDKNGTVLPSKILNTSKEESFEIYENRFIYTLLLKIRDFIDRRYESIKSAIMQSGELSVDIKSDFAIDKNKVSYDLTSRANFPFDAVVKKRSGGLTDVERIDRMSSIINDFLGSAFSKEMRSSALVRPPIQRTNVILKDPNFKKALVLWQFIESNERMDFKVENVTESAELSPSLSEKYRSLIFLNTVLMQSIADSREIGESIEEVFKKDDVVADEYTTKNIDDYVPDDFPALKMDLSEIKRIYQRMPFTKVMSLTDQSKMKAAIDRCLRQTKINKAKEDGKMQQRLIAQQLAAEEEAKELALREERDAERKKRQDEARRRLEARRLEKERQAELKRLEIERKKQEELAAKQAEEARKEEERMAKENAEKEAEAKAAAEKAAEARRLAEEHRAAVEAQKRALIDEKLAYESEQKRIEKERREHENKQAKLEADIELAKEEEKSKTRIAQRHDEELEEVKEVQKKTMEDLRDQTEKYWIQERELAKQKLVDEGINSLNVLERVEIQKLIDNTRKKEEQIALIDRSLGGIITLNHREEVEQILYVARNNHTEEEMDDLIISIDKDYRKQSRAIKQKRFKKKIADMKKEYASKRERNKLNREARKLRKGEKGGKDDK